MKKIIYSILAVSVMAFASCAEGEAESTEKEANPEKTPEVEVFNGSYATADDATITWKARHYADEDFVHVGTVATSGTVSVENSEIVGGVFTFDLARIDEEGDTEMTQMLEGHLKNPDFFNIELNPSATLTITGVEEGVVTGDLTVMGISKSIDIPAMTTLTGNDLIVEVNSFEVDMLGYALQALVGAQELPEEEKMQTPYPMVTFDISLTLTNPSEI